MKNEWYRMKKSSLVEGTFIATLAIVIVKLLGMLYVIPFYAIVGPLGGALYAYAYNIYNIFLDISTVGLPIAISKITNEYNTLKMMDAKSRAFKISIKVMRFASIIIFLLLFIFAKPIGSLIIGDLVGGNSSDDIACVIRFVSISLLIIPYLSVTKGYLQGHGVVNVSSVANVLEQVIRIFVILAGSYLVINILHHSYVEGVSIALTGAFFGGLAAYFYVRWKMNKNKSELSLDEVKKKDKVSNKEIVKKIIMYALPFIIINCVSSLYSFVDMILVMRGLEFVSFDHSLIEFVATSISTWSGKINMIIISLAMGMTMSLIPSIVNSFTLKKWDQVNVKINSSLRIIIYISLPMAIGLSLLSGSVWSIFYGASEIGANILSVSVFVAVSLNLYMISSSILQSLNKFKLVYKAAIFGFVLNALLDIPLMFICSKIGIPAYLGALFASIIGYLSSVYIALKNIRTKENKINYNDTFKTLVKTLIACLMMIVVVVIVKMIIPCDLNSKISCLIYIAINAIVGVIVYLFASYKMGLIDEVIGRDNVKKIIKKLTRK